MFAKSIRKEVMKAVEEKIESAQKDYEQKCKVIQAEAELSKVEAFNSAVNTIIGNIINPKE